MSIRSTRRQQHERRGVLAPDAFGVHGSTLMALVIDLVIWRGVTELRGGQTISTFLVPAALVVAYLFMFFCSARSVVPWAVMWTLGVLAGLLMPGFLPIAGLGTGVFRIARNRSRRLAVAVFVASLVPIGLNAINSAQELGDGRVWAYPVALAIWGGLISIPFVTGRFSRVTQLQAREEQREREAAAELRLRAERLRLARELHDIVSHSVSAMILQAAGARATTTEADPKVLGALAAVENTGVQAMRELHRMLGLLRAVEGRPDDGVGPDDHATVTDIDNLLTTARSCGVDVELITGGNPRPLDPSIDNAAYRMVQESLSNVIKHAGRGATARIHLLWEPTALKITVRSAPGIADNAPRTDLSTGLGLRGLQERIDLVGGRFEAGSTADGAFITRAELPWAAAAAPGRTNVEAMT